MDMETFGKRFSRLRREKGLTQEDIANKINISAQAVSKWENDLTSPDISVLAELSDILGVSLDELLGKSVPKTAEVLPPEQRPSIEKMTLKITVDSAKGDKVRLNLPITIVKMAIECGMEMPSINENRAFENIDFKQILSLVEQGVVGEIVRVDSADGDHVLITVE